MTKSYSNPKGTKALLAIAFAGNFLSAQHAALGQESPKEAVSPSALTTSTSPSSIIETIVASGKANSEEKAYYLLQLAEYYVSDKSTTQLETYIRVRLGSTIYYVPRSDWVKGEHPFAIMARSVSRLGQSLIITAQFGAGDTRYSNARRAEVDRAIAAALAQLDQGYKIPEALNLYLIASCLSQITGNSKNEQKCNAVLSEAIQACEANKPVDSVQIKVIASILDSKAYGLVPIQIEDMEEKIPFQRPSFAKEDIDASERLKLLAAALLDRLPNTDQARRKAHRDLCLWYSSVGKDEKSREEKQELFKLVGVSNDRILYPQPGTCGHLVWWSAEKIGYSGQCGMG